jgi:hypothetical protein
MVHPTAFVAGMVASLLLLSACASSGPGEMTMTTSSPRAVDPRDDNAQVLTQSKPGLVITLHIEGAEVRSFEVSVAGLSGSSSAGDQGDEVVRVTGMMGGAKVASMSIPDQRLNAQEGGGLVINESRTLVGRLVLPSRIDTLEVEIQGAERTQELDVRGAFGEYCEKRADQAICRRKGQ